MPKFNSKGQAIPYNRSLQIMTNRERIILYNIHYAKALRQQFNDTIDWFDI